MKKDSDSRSAPLDRGVLRALCVFLVLLFFSSLFTLLGEGTAGANFVAFEQLYLLVVLVQAIFGVFVLPFILPAGGLSAARLVDIVILFSAALPFMAVGAAAAGSAWYAVLLSQMLVFALWSVALAASGALRAGARTAGLYLPVSALLFFGLLVAGSIMESFSVTAGAVASLSIPGVVASWSSGRFLGLQGWLGAAACIAALALWSKKLLMDVHR